MKVLVPIDGSEQSMKAVEKALALAEKQGAEVTLMSVAYSAGDIPDEMPLNIQSKMDAEAQGVLDKAKARFDAKGVKVTAVLERGVVPANNILRKAEEGKFDQIIMGSTGRTGLAKFLLGSTAAKVMAHASCDVTIVR